MTAERTWPMPADLDDPARRKGGHPYPTVCTCGATEDSRFDELTCKYGFACLVWTYLQPHGTDATVRSVRESGGGDG